MLNLFEQGQLFTSEYTVTPEVYRLFIEAFQDTNALHTDAGFAARHQFPGVVMHGNILGGFLSHFVGMRLPTSHVMIYSQQLGFKKAVFMHDKLQLQATVKGLFESVNVVEFRVKFYREPDRTVVADGNLQIGILP